MAGIEIGKHWVADSRVCGRRLIFKGTRILVSDALELTAAGYSPEAIARQYRGILSPKGIREALTLTRRGIVERSWREPKPLYRPLLGDTDGDQLFFMSFLRD